MPVIDEGFFTALVSKMTILVRNRGDRQDLIRFIGVHCGPGSNQNQTNILVCQTLVCRIRFFILLRCRAMFGEELRRAREKAGLTQESLAFEAGVHRTYVSLLERNRKSPTLSMLFRLCKAMGVSPSKLVARVEKAMVQGSGRERVR
jgi:DNA-binding XRE family transcriptional regulator